MNEQVKRWQTETVNKVPPHLTRGQGLQELCRHTNVPTCQGRKEHGASLTVTAALHRGVGDRSSVLYSGPKSLRLTSEGGARNALF